VLPGTKRFSYQLLDPLFLPHPTTKGAQRAARLGRGLRCQIRSGVPARSFPIRYDAVGEFRSSSELVEVRLSGVGARATLEPGGKAGQVRCRGGGNVLHRAA
jgi:hypothetical protein